MKYKISIKDGWYWLSRKSQNDFTKKYLVYLEPTGSLPDILTLSIIEYRTFKGNNIAILRAWVIVLGQRII